MQTLQKSFLWEGSIPHSPIRQLNLRFNYSQFDYEVIFDSNGQVARKSAGTGNTEITQDVTSKEYQVVLPADSFTGKTVNTPGLMLQYLEQQLSTNYPNTLDKISLSVETEFRSEDDIAMGKTAPVEAILFMKNFYSRVNYGPVDVEGKEGVPAIDAARFIERNAFLVNKAVYSDLIEEMNARAGSSGNLFYLLYIIAYLTDLSSGTPKLADNLSQDDKDGMLQIFNNMELQDPQKETDYIRSNFDRLFDFPVSTKNIQVQEVSGTLTITTTDNTEITVEDLSLYDLSLEYTTIDEDGQEVLSDVHFDWTTNKNKVKNNAVAFSFSDSTLIIPAAPHEPITVYVRSSDSTILWSKEYKSGSPALQNIQITIPLIGGGVITPAERAASNSKRLRGQLLDMTKKAVLKDAVIAVMAKKETNAEWIVVASATADSSGNFSMPYPFGVYVAAQALVSLMPSSPASIPVNMDKGDNKTISDDFLYLLLKEVENPAGTPGKDDCGCHDTTKASRLPDQADLIQSDEYTQDLGAGCINLSTPNRTLREYPHYAIVRTSDPDVSNYMLTKEQDGSFILTGDNKKIKRKAVDLTNPVRWQDAPDKHENLSFYQSVTVATGHILHYKSQFKADGYSLGELLYSLPLAPGQKKQIVIFDSQHSLTGSESQQLSQSERLAANITNDRDIADQLSGGISEALRGNSSATTEGVSVGLGVSASAGAIGGSLGVAGGYSNAHSDATQDSSRDISQFFNEKLRNSIMQNADAYRQQNASVITTVSEGQRYSASTEVIANHNHCHSLTMMYFEVLRHFAIYQELTNVEECVFVPLLMTNFTTDNIYKWRDILAPRLLPLPSNTYLPSVDGLHPLAKAFDAVERKRTNYTMVDYPTGSFDEEPIVYIKGNLQIRVNLPRPKTKYDRILSLPIVNKTVYHEEVDPEAIAKNIALAPLTFGFSMFGSNTKQVAEQIQVKAQIFDSFMQLDANYESVPPAQCIRVNNFYPVYLPQDILSFFGLSSKMVSGEDFFSGDKIDRDLWVAYALLLGHTDVYEMLTHYFKGALISEWDTIFYNDIAPALFEKIVDSLTFAEGLDENTGQPLNGIKTDLTSFGKYRGGEVVMNLNVRAHTTKTRRDLANPIYFASGSKYLKGINTLATLILENLTLNYATSHFNGTLYNGYLGDDVQDGATIDIPETAADKRNPHKEDDYLQSKLIEHLNSNLEYYNKVLWYNLDADRRYMLLDGFNIQVFNDFGVPVGLKSLASVIKNELMAVAGNSLVFPVSSGFKVSKSYIVEKTETGTTEKVSLMDHYRPLTPIPPYRISVPSRGVFGEAMRGSCDACEKVQDNTSQDWDKFKTDEPTTFNPVATPTPVVTDYKAMFKDFTSPLVSIQNAPAAPAPGAGLAGFSDALTKAGVFKDVTGLDKNQQNAIETYKSNQENAKAFAEMSKSLATQAHNTDNSSKILDTLKAAKDSGAISQADYSDLVKKHLQQQIDGGDSEKAKAAAAAEKLKTDKDKKLTDTVAKAADAGKKVEVTEKDDKGNAKSVKIGEGSMGNGTTATTDKILAQVPGGVEALGSSDPNKDNECWAIVATMMTNWKTQKSMSVPARTATWGDTYLRKYTDDTGLFAADKADFLKTIGLVGESPASYDLSQYISWMNTYGPLWVTIDSNTDAGTLSPHAWVLTKITGTATPEGATFTYNDPATGEEETIAFLDFVKQYEQVITDNTDDDYFIQIVHFSDKIATAPSTAPVKDYTIDSDPKFLFSNKKSSFRKLKEAPVLFFKASMSVDVDGAPNAYHYVTDDEWHEAMKSRGKNESANSKKGLDNIFNATSSVVRYEKDDKSKGVKKGDKVIHEIDGEQYFVSGTALTSGDYTLPSSYVDATEIPYIVIPKPVFVDYPVRKGDFAVVYDTVTKTMKFAIFADIASDDGGGESSLKLVDEFGLANAVKDGRGGGTSAKRMLYIVFCRSGNLKPRTYDEIQTEAAKQLAQYGGQDFIDKLVNLA